MEIFVFARFHARPANAAALEEALSKVTAATRTEAGCLKIHVFRSIRDPQTFYIHSHWRDEAAFDIHATLPHTIRFIEQAERLVDHEIQAQRFQLVV